MSKLETKIDELIGAVDIQARRDIAVNSEKIHNLQDGVEDIQHKVSNCIPSSIANLAKENQEAHNDIYNKIGENKTWLIASLTTALIGVLGILMDIIIQVSKVK